MSEAILGIDIGGTNVKVVLLEGSDARELRGIATKSEPDPARLLAQLRETLQSELNGGSLPRVGLSVAGLLDFGGVLVEAPNLRGFVGHDMRRLWAQEMPFELVALENDVQCAMFGEFAAGAAREIRHAVMLSLGTGVGGGVLVDGNLLRGAGGFAAELGHLLLDPDGPLCACGKNGHVESYLSSSAIVTTAREKLELSDAESSLRDASEELSVEVISRAAHAGDGLATEVLADRGFYLGLAATQLAHAFNPAICVIGGGVAGSGDFLLEPARRTLRERGMEAPASMMKIVAAELGPTGAARGAALLAQRAG